MKRWIAVILAVMLVCALAACGNKKPNNTNNNNNNNNNSSSSSVVPTTAPKPTESPDKEVVFGDMKITLPKEFVDNKALIPSDSDIKCYYTNTQEELAFAALNEEKSDFAKTKVQSLDDYLEVQHTNSKGSVTSEIKEDNGLKYFDYEAEGTNGTIYKYFSTAFESDDYYWFVQFYTTKEQYSKYESKFLEWSHTVTKA